MVANNIFDGVVPEEETEEWKRFKRENIVETLAHYIELFDNFMSRWIEKITEHSKEDRLSYQMEKNLFHQNETLNEALNQVNNEMPSLEKDDELQPLNVPSIYNDDEKMD